MLCGSITFDPTKPASPPCVSCEIVGYFRNRQELAELLAKMSAAHDAPAAHSPTCSPDLRQGSAEDQSAGDGSTFAIPDGLTLADLQECVQLLDDRDLVLYDHQARDESDPQNDCELIARIYERLRAAAERNSTGS